MTRKRKIIEASPTKSRVEKRLDEAVARQKAGDMETNLLKEH